MSTIIAVREDFFSGNGGECSPTKEKASNGGVFGARSPLLYRRLRLVLFAGAKHKLLLLLCILASIYFLGANISSLMGWNPDHPTSMGGYTVLINTSKRNSILKQSIAHYASCRGTDAIHVVWSEANPPSYKLTDHLKKLVLKKKVANKPNFRFDIYKDDNLNNRFKPIEDLRTDAIFSVDDDVVVPCGTLDFAFSVWQTAPRTMLGFVPRMHWLTEEKDGAVNYRYGGWWSVWWTGTYSMVLPKAAFFHKMYLELYTNRMPQSIQDYIRRERSCEDIAMSLLVANASRAPPVWVKGQIHEIGSSGTSSLKGHSEKRSKCLDYFISLYGTVPLVSTNVKAVDAQHAWFW